MLSVKGMGLLVRVAGATALLDEDVECAGRLDTEAQSSPLPCIDIQGMQNR